MSQKELKVAVKGLVENYYIIQETRKALDLREQSLCRDEVILLATDKEGKEKKVIGRIIEEDDDQVVVEKVTQKGNIILKEVSREDIRKIIYHKFDSIEEAQREIFRFPIGKREADVSSVPLKRLEKDIKSYLRKLIADWPVWCKWLKNVKGVGEVISGGIFAYVDIHKCEKVSQLWHYAGQHVVDGEIPRLKKGVKRSWNRRLQTIIWNFGETIEKSGTKDCKVGYKSLYNKRKEHEIANRFLVYLLDEGHIKGIDVDGKWRVRTEDEMAGFIAGHLLNEAVGRKKKGHYIQNKASAMSILRAKKEAGENELKLERKPAHINNRTKRFVRKVFLGHVYEFWRGEEGLPVYPVYPVGKDPSHSPIPIIWE